jgi:cell division transport system permease protein
MRGPLHAAAYCAEESLRNLWANRVMTLLSVATIAVAFFVWGLMLLGQANAESALRAWAQRVRVNLFLDESLAEEEKAGALLAALRAMPEVESARYVSKDEALEQMRALYPGIEQSLALLEHNPLPPGVELVLKAEHGKPEDVRRFASQSAVLAGVREVQYDLQWVEKAQRLFARLRLAGLAAGLIFLAATAFTLYNVVRLTVYSRQEEIAIMEVVGAPGAYVRGPFLLEATLAGAAGAALALAVLIAGYWILHESVAHLPWAEVWRPVFLTPRAQGMLLGAGAAMGLLGSILALRRLPQS